jgi:hypothetical protein
MGQVLHSSATTPEAVRRAIQNSEESLRALSARYGINQKTVAKWKKRTSVADLPTGPEVTSIRPVLRYSDRSESTRLSLCGGCVRWRIHLLGIQRLPSISPDVWTSLVKVCGASDARSLKASPPIRPRRWP